MLSRRPSHEAGRGLLGAAQSAEGGEEIAFLYDERAKAKVRPFSESMAGRSNPERAAELIHKEFAT